MASTQPLSRGSRHPSLASHNRRSTIVSVASPVARSDAPTAQPQVRKAVALKEWNVAIAALHRGEQTVLLRKGGIREPVFKPEGREFLLFPTAFHSQEGLIKPGPRGSDWCKQALSLEPKEATHLSLGTYVEVTGAWVTEDPGVLAALDDLHIWTQEFVEARLKWRSKQPLTLLEVRAWRLQPPLELTVNQEFFGCFSFVDLQSGLLGQQLPSSVTLQGATPALTDEEFASRQRQLRSKLAGIKCEELHL